MQNLFAEFDESGTGAINVDDLMSVFAKIGTPLTRQKANALILEGDFDGNGEIDYVEFLGMVVDQRMQEGDGSSKLLKGIASTRNMKAAQTHHHILDHLD